MPARESSACSKLLPERMRAGDSADRPRASRAEPMRSARSKASRYVSSRQAPSSARSARNTRSGAIFAQCSRRSIQESGYGGSGWAVRTTTTPSGRVSTIGSSGPNNCFGGLAADIGFPLGGQFFAALPFPRRLFRAADLAGPFLQKRVDASLGLVVALGDRGHQRFHEIADARIAFGDARQRLDDGEIDQRRVARHRLGERKAFGEALAVLDQILRE